MRQRDLFQAGRAGLREAAVGASLGAGFASHEGVSLEVTLVLRESNSSSTAT